MLFAGCGIYNRQTLNIPAFDPITPVCGLKGWVAPDTRFGFSIARKASDLPSGVTTHRLPNLTCEVGEFPCFPTLRRRHIELRLPTTAGKKGYARAIGRPGHVALPCAFDLGRRTTR